jgi:ribonuclease R
MVLHHLAERQGEVFEGVIIGVTDFGVFVQSPEFLVEGLVRLQNLGDDWWNVFSDKGRIVGEITGKVYKIGDTVEVRIDRVDVPKRHLDLTLTETPERTSRRRSRALKKNNRSKTPIGTRG